MKRFLATLLLLCMLMSMLPTTYAVHTSQTSESIVLTEEDYAVTDTLWAQIDELEARLSTKDGDLEESAIQSIIETIKASANYVDDSMKRDEYAITWKTTEGIACYYSLDGYDDDRGESIGEPIEVPESGYEYISYAKKGQPNGKDVYLVGPYYGIDSDFTDHYKTVAKSIASKTGGSYTLYSGYNVTLDKVATAISNGAIVLIDSHGTYDSSQSYLRLNSGTGITTEDYNGSAYYNSDGEYMVTGNAIVNHMTKEAPNSFVWFGICSGMRFSTMHRPVMNYGVEATFGYSRTISFHYDRYWLSAFINALIAGKTVAQAASTMKSSVGYWDRCDESSYDTYNEAVNAGKAFPIFVSAEDSYPSTLQNYQTVKSTWKLSACTHSSLSYVTQTAVTCTQNGSSAHYKCNTCNGLFVDANASASLTSEQVVITATGHNYVEGVCTKCSAIAGTTLWHFWKGSTEANYSWVAVDTNDSSTSPTVTTTGRGTLSSVSNGDDHHFYMEMGTGSMGHTVQTGDIIEIRYRTVDVPSSLENTSGTFELWYTTTDNDSSFSSSMVYTASVTHKENEWQTVTFTPASGITLKRILFDFLQEDKGFTGTKLEIDYMYVGPQAYAPSSQKTDELFFDFTNDEAAQFRYSGSVYGDHNFDNGTWYIGSNFSSQSIDNTAGTFSGVLSSGATSCAIRTATEGTAEEMPLAYKPGSGDYFQTYLKIEDAEATADQINVDFYYFTTSDNAWHFSRSTADKSVLGNYFIVSIPMSAVSSYLNAGTITSLQMNIGNIQSVSGKNAKVTVDYIYVGAQTPKPVAHEYTLVVTAPTCTQQGYTTYTCNLCGYNFASDYTDATNHANTSTQTTQATCDQAGEKKVVCDDCGTVLSTEVIPAGNHAQTTTLRVEPTCMNDGEISVVCDLCGEVLSKEVLPASDHEYEAVVTAPTCTERGYTTYICFCGDSYVTDYVAATGHSYSAKVTIAPACEAEGEQTFTCACGASYTTMIAATGHDYESSLTEATCEQEGFTTYTCKLCGDSYKDHYVSAYGHAYSYANNDDGTHNTTCAYDCGYTSVDQCVFTNGMCVCGALEAISCEHVNVTTTTVAVTCTTNGTKTVICDDCAETILSETIPALGHSIETIPARDATCTEVGCRAHWYCVSCNSHFADGDGKYLLPEYFFEIEATGHDVTYYEAKQPTCTENGNYNYYGCKNCGACFFDELCEYSAPESYVFLAATGHSYSYVNNGADHTVSCANCSYSETTTHSYVEDTCICGAIYVYEPVYKLDSNLKFTMNIAVGTEMTVSYNIMGTAVNSYADFYLEVTKEVANGDSITTVYGITADREQMTAKLHPTTGEALMYQVTYKGINAKEMGDNFSTTLYAVSEDGTIYYGNTVVDSIKSFLVGKIDATTSSAELKTMAVDMLKYGAAAQTRLGYNTENLVTADLTEAQLAYATQENPEAVDYATSAGNGANVNTNITVTSKVQLNLSCVYTKATDPSAVKCIITDEKGNILAELATTNKGGIMFSAVYEDVGAKEMRKVINAVFYEGNTIISKMVSWSVESYVAQIRAKTTATADEINMVNAMLTYGDAVATYMATK